MSKVKTWEVSLIDYRPNTKPFFTEKVNAEKASDVRKIIKEKYGRKVEINSLKY